MRYRFWYVQHDILGGLGKLDVEFYTFVEGVYAGVLAIHIAALVLTVLIMAGFLLAILRPFLAKTSNETRRIAELLAGGRPSADSPVVNMPAPLAPSIATHISRASAASPAVTIMVRLAHTIPDASITASPRFCWRPMSQCC